MPRAFLLAALGALAAVLLTLRDEEPVSEAPGEPDEGFPPFDPEPWPFAWPEAIPIDPLPEPSSSWPGTVNAPVPGTFPGGHNEYDNQILYACNLYGMIDALAPLLVKAIIRHESGWNPQACGDRLGAPGLYRSTAWTSGCCSLGLMQVNRCAHPALASRLDLRDPNQNILAGAELLSLEYRRYWPDWERVFVGYNGPALAARGVRSNAYSQAVAANFRSLTAQIRVTV